MRRSLWFALLIVGGIATGWVLRGARSGSVPPERPHTVQVDCSRPILITRVHVKDHFAQKLQPFHVNSGEKRTTFGDRPPEGEVFWIVTFNGGTVQVYATQSPDY